MLRRLLKYQEDDPVLSFDIFEASYGGLWKAVQWHLEHGVDPNKEDENGWPPLMYAAYAGHVQTVLVLLDAGADGHIQDQGYTAFDWAKEKGHLEIQQMLQLLHSA